jgi:hypothetical protein
MRVILAVSMERPAVQAGHDDHSPRGVRGRKEPTVGEHEYVGLEDVMLAAHLYRTSRGRLAKRSSRAYRDRLIRACYAQGDVTREQLAEAAHLSLSQVDAIRRAGSVPLARPRLRIVRDG